MKQDVRWFAVAREDLIDVLLGEEEPRGGGALSPADLELRHGALALGYRPLSYGARTASQPTAVVIPDNSAVETLSWLRVYAEEAFPISQFARVARLTDWDIFGRIGSSTSEYSFRPERWASVAVGETLAQADSEVDLQAMPLSRIASSLSLPVGRTASLFGHGEPTRVCVDRLRILCDDARLGRRAIGVDHLAPIWALCTATVAGHLEPHEAAQLVVDACIAHLRDSAPNARLQDVEFLSRFPGLRSDSVEHRVMAFTELAQAIAALPAVELGGLGATLLAAGCFMVGRSTSHAFLLNRFQKLAPTAFAWFGLMAALAGPRAWDIAWLRAVKGAERLLRPDFAWTDAPTADIGWAEFSWLAGTFDDIDHLVALPKMLPRTLGVEVVPGVVLQVRLGHGTVEESRAAPAVSVRERSLVDALNQIIRVAVRASGSTDGELGERGQQSLDLDHPTGAPATVKASRSKKTKRDGSGS